MALKSGSGLFDVQAFGGQAKMQAQAAGSLCACGCACACACTACARGLQQRRLRLWRGLRGRLRVDLASGAGPSSGRAREDSGRHRRRARGG